MRPGKYNKDAFKKFVDSRASGRDADDFAYSRVEIEDLSCLNDEYGLSETPKVAELPSVDYVPPCTKYKPLSEAEKAGVAYMQAEVGDRYEVINIKIALLLKHGNVFKERPLHVKVENFDFLKRKIGRGAIVMPIIRPVLHPSYAHGPSIEIGNGKHTLLALYARGFIEAKVVVDKWMSPDIGWLTQDQPEGAMQCTHI